MLKKSIRPLRNSQEQELWCSPLNETISSISITIKNLVTTIVRLKTKDAWWLGNKEARWRNLNEKRKKL